MLMIYTSIECENHCFEGQIVKNAKTQNFGSSRSVIQNDHYFRSYTRQKTLIILYELLYACVL